MRSIRSGEHIIVRIDRGENLLDQLNTVCKLYSVKCASVSGIGATDSFTCGVLNMVSKEYKEIRFDGTYEILSLAGNITTMNEHPYIHLHITVGDESGRCFGGHLKEARISATCEIVIHTVDYDVSRIHDDATGLNLLDI